MEPQNIVERALELARDRQKSFPTFGMFESIVLQLEYLQNVLADKNADRSRLKEIIIGHYGARELMEVDPEFAESLLKAQTIASRMADGLKP
ncbi:MAG: immunity protein Tsi6 family protein [Planctomycetaceae bacterium]